MEVRLFSEEFSDQWDEFCIKSGFGTFQHTRKFLNYHGLKFKDRSMILWDNDKISGIFPAAQHPNNMNWVISHPGAAMGSLITSTESRGRIALEGIPKLIDKYKELGIAKLFIKEIPYIYNAIPRDEASFALISLGARIESAKLSVAIDLRNRLKLSGRRKRALAKRPANLEIVNSNGLIDDFWEVLVENLRIRYASKPVHTLDEMKFLVQEFPKEIQLWCVLESNKVQSGVLLFNSPYVWHCQYIATSELGRKLNSLDFLYQAILSDSMESEIRYFDFGTSNLSDWRLLNRSLFEFKAEFGGSGVLYTQLALDLS